MTTLHLLLRDIAPYIQRPGKSSTAALDRLRNWTKMGIIKPSGVPHPGRGRKKSFSSAALMKAVLLQTLIDTFGAPAVNLSGLADELAQMVRRGSVLSGQRLIVFGRRQGSSRTSIAEIPANELQNYISQSDFDIHLVVNLNRVFLALPYDLLDVFPEATAEVEKATGRKVRVLRKPKKDGAK